MAAWIIDLIAAGGILGPALAAAAYLRLRTCRHCHGSGVILLGECTCGASYTSGHEAYCGVAWCPKGCKAVETKDEALRIWAMHT